MAPRIVLLTGPFPAHIAFAHTVADAVPVAAVVQETRTLPSTPWISRAAARARAAGLAPASLLREAGRWMRTRHHDRMLQPRTRARLPRPLHVRDLNSGEGIDVVRSLEPDLIAVCGTGLLSPDVFGLARRGAINLHLGISPRYRGSHCVFWPLYNREPEWIGITVHYLDRRIDAGPILLQRRPVIEPADDLESLVRKCLSAGFAAMADALGRLSHETLAGVPQRLEEGRNYNARELTPERAAELARRLHAGFLEDWLRERGGVVPAVPLINV